MKSIAIVTDSNCGMSPAQATKSRLQSFHIPAHAGIRHYPLGQAAQRLRRDRTYPHVQRSLQLHADCPYACRRL